MSQCHCPSCGAAEWTVLATIRNSFSLLRCAGCSLLRSEGTPRHGTGKDEFARLNLDAYFESMAPIRRESSINLLTRIESLVTKGSILDIGCSFGWFLDEAKARGWETFGIEPSDLAFDYADRKKMHNLHHGIFPADGFGGKLFDAIVMMDVLEHLCHPVAVLSAVHGVLRPGGVAAIKVPNQKGLIYTAASLLNRASFGNISMPIWRLWQFDFPYPHLWYFDPRSLRRVAKNAGLDPVIEDTEPIVTVASIPNRLGYVFSGRNLGERTLLPFYAVGLAACTIAAMVARREDISLLIAVRPRTTSSGTRPQ